jgi:hypothetical protein
MLELFFLRCLIQPIKLIFQRLLRTVFESSTCPTRVLVRRWQRSNQYWESKAFRQFNLLNGVCLELVIKGSFYVKSEFLSIRALQTQFFNVRTRFNMSNKLFHIILKSLMTDFRLILSTCARTHCIFWMVENSKTSFSILRF